MATPNIIEELMPAIIKTEYGKACSECGEEVKESYLYGYGKLYFCSREHKDKWLKRRAYSIMQKQAVGREQQDFVEFLFRIEHGP